MITIKNSDSTCAARALVTAVANLSKDLWTESQLHNGFGKSRKLQRDEALRLHREADVPVREEGSDLDDLKRFAKHLGVCVKVPDGEKFNKLVFETEMNEKVDCLLKNGNHFDVITSLPGFLGANYFCQTCSKTYSNRDCTNALLSARAATSTFLTEKRVLRVKTT